MCNLGRVKEGDRVMDPYSGSCSTLLASAMIAPTSQSVGIEIAGDDVVNRERIYEDFESRGLRSPVQLIHGDCTDDVIRNIALNAVGKQAFDVILADPPYGRREKASKNQKPPLVQLIECMGADLQRGEPLLRRGGRLVAFVPTNEGEDVNDGLPSQADLDKAGLEMTSLTEQPLSETLSRWLAVFYYKRSVDLNIS
jgi:tRNA G10  N-methylase Trm11